MLDDARIGVLGEVSKGAADEYELRTTPCLGELDFDALVEAAQLDMGYVKPPEFPPIVRDLAIEVREEVSWDSVRECVVKAGAEYLESVTFFDLYRGKQIASGHKSIAFAITYRASDRTLKSEEAEASQQRVLAALETDLGARLRSQ